MCFTVLKCGVYAEEYDEIMEYCVVVTLQTSNSRTKLDMFVFKLRKIGVIRLIH